MSHNNSSRSLDTAVSISWEKQLPGNQSKDNTAPPDALSVKETKELATEGRDLDEPSQQVPWSDSQQNIDLEEKEHRKLKTKRRYGIFLELPTEDPGTPPDGGVIAWSQVLAGHLMCFVTWGLITSFGIFQSYYEETLDVSPSTVSWIGTVQIFTLLLVGTISGRASDAGLVHEAVFTGTAMIVFGIFMTSLSTRYYQLFLSQGICVGLGMGILYMPGLSVPSSYFKEKKPFAVAIIASGAGSGGLVYPAMVQQLLSHIGEFALPSILMENITHLHRLWVDASVYGVCYFGRGHPH